MAGTDNREVVNALGRVRKQVRDLDSALAVLLESSPRTEQLRVALDELVLGLGKFLRPRLPFELVEQWLGIERIKVARAAGHEQEDHGLCLCGNVGQPRCERVSIAGASLLVLDERRESETAETAK